MAVRISAAGQRLQASLHLGQFLKDLIAAIMKPSMIGPITLAVKKTGERNAGNPHAAFDVAGTGIVSMLEML